MGWATSRKKWLAQEGEQEERTLDTKTLIVDFRSRPPHMTIKGDAPSGPMVEILLKALNNLGYGIRWQFRPFEQSIDALKSGETDIVPRIFLEKERKAYVSFIGPIASETKKVQFLIRSGFLSEADSHPPRISAMRKETLRLRSAVGQASALRMTVYTCQWTLRQPGISNKAPASYDVGRVTMIPLRNI